MPTVPFLPCRAASARAGGVLNQVACDRTAVILFRLTPLYRQAAAACICITHMGRLSVPNQQALRCRKVFFHSVFQGDIRSACAHACTIADGQSLSQQSQKSITVFNHSTRCTGSALHYNQVHSDVSSIHSEVASAMRST